MGAINYGNQQISFEYNERLRAAEANELLSGVLRPGVVTWPAISGSNFFQSPVFYSSQTLTVSNGLQFSGNEIIIQPFTALLQCLGPFGEKMLVKVTTTAPISINGTGVPTPLYNNFTTNIIYMNYTWSESPGNFADIGIVSSIGTPDVPPYSIILGSYLTDKFGQFVYFTSISTGGLTSQFREQGVHSPGGPVLADIGDYADVLRYKLAAGPNVTITSETNPPPLGSAYYGVISSFKQLRITSLDEKVRITANDTTPSTLQNKITSDSNFTWTLLNPGGNEQLRLEFAGSLQFDKIKISAADTVNDYLYNSVVTDSFLSKSIQNPGADEKLLISNLRPGHRIVDPSLGVMPQRQNFSLFGYGFALADDGVSSTTLTLGARTASHAPILGTHNLNLETHEVHYVDLQGVPGGAIILTLTNVANDGKTVLVRIKQGAIPVTITFSNTIKWRGGLPTFTITPNAIDMVSFFYDGLTGTIFGLAALNFT